MPVLSQPSPAARTSLIYITIGSLMDVAMAVWYIYLHNHDAGGFDAQYYWCAGLFLAGLVVLIIGLALGRIGRAARHAELPPPEVTGAEARAEQNAAARAPMVAPINPMQQMAPNGAPMPTAAVPTTPPMTGVPPVAVVPPARPVGR